MTVACLYRAPARSGGKQIERLCCTTCTNLYQAEPMSTAASTPPVVINPTSYPPLIQPQNRLDHKPAQKRRAIVMYTPVFYAIIIYDN
jgi:hypothetical protein